MARESAYGIRVHYDKHLFDRSSEVFFLHYVHVSMGQIVNNVIFFTSHQEYFSFFTENQSYLICFKHHQNYHVTSVFIG